jgi:hypothetical protein
LHAGRRRRRLLRGPRRYPAARLAPTVKPIPDTENDLFCLIIRSGCSGRIEKAPKGFIESRAGYSLGCHRFDYEIERKSSIGCFPSRGYAIGYSGHDSPHPSSRILYPLVTCRPQCVSYSFNCIGLMGSTSAWVAPSRRCSKSGPKSFVSICQTGSLPRPPNLGGRRKGGRLAGSSGAVKSPPVPG